MTTQQRATIASILSIIVALGAAIYLGRTQIDAFAFNLTGEKGTVGQVRGLIQLTLNFDRRRLELDPYAPIEHAAVSPFGINTFLQLEVEEAKREETLRLLNEAGFDWIRQQFPWEDIEISAKGDFIDRRNDPNGIDAWAKYDNIVALAEEYDIEIIARIDNPPAWSREAPIEEIGSLAPPDDYDDFAEFAAILAERYKGRITYYQIWNEPNCCEEWGINRINPEEFTELLCLTYDAIKEVDPDAVIVSPAMAPTNEMSNRSMSDFVFWQRMYDAGARECFDVLAMQGYGLFSGPYDRRMDPITVNYARPLYIRDLMVRNGDANKAIWISEMNWNVAPEDVEPRYGRVTLQEQAEWGPLAYQRAQREWPWVGVVNFWFFKRADDLWLNERRPEAYFQMSTADFDLQPVYETMKTYANQTPVVYKGNHPSDHWAIMTNATGAEFVFSGHTVEVQITSTASGGCLSTLQVNQNEPRTLEECNGTLTWRGPNDRHNAVLTLGPTEQIERIIVRDEPRPLPAIAIASIITMMLAGVIVLKRSP